MTRKEAHRLLDAAQAGAKVSTLAIITALRATGDLSPLRLCSRAPEPVRAPPNRRSAAA